MSRESVPEKALRYIAGNRVRIDLVGAGAVHAFVKGSDATHQVRWRDGRWSCTCQARTYCSHLNAVQLVVGENPS